MALMVNKLEGPGQVVHWVSSLTMAWIPGLLLSFPYAFIQHLDVLTSQHSECFFVCGMCFLISTLLTGKSTILEFSFYLGDMMVQ